VKRVENINTSSTKDRRTCRCEYCSPGSNTLNDALPLVLSGEEGEKIAKKLGLSGREHCCCHCKNLILAVIERIEREKNT
jgi:hypothetical protein